ncbi:MAG: crossover junction endodeoxyribonuclease RuvC [Candidatus Jorgensenbacteria bacterium]|nr:crossover junction endodeoxyribonuclease RuvC [Candidatus Jorgensenbacteria bacterium]
MIILGIDPGTTRIGYGAVEKTGGTLTHHASGLIECASGNLAEQLHIIEKRVEDVIKKTKPAKAGVEKLFFSKNKKTALTTAHARGVILSALRKHNIEIVELSPVEVKLGVTGYGSASKQAVAAMVSRILNISTKNVIDDTTDALAIAITAAYTSINGR